MKSEARRLLEEQARRLLEEQATRPPLGKLTGPHRYHNFIIFRFWTQAGCPQQAQHPIPRERQFGDLLLDFIQNYCFAGRDLAIQYIILTQ